MAKGKAKVEATPIFRQFTEIKRQYPDAILFFRLGDFYEVFESDADTVAPILGVAPAARTLPTGEIVMCVGVPFHSAEGHIAKLIAAGKKVAVCEQIGGAR